MHPTPPPATQAYLLGTWPNPDDSGEVGQLKEN